MPRFLNLVVAIYLICVGLIGLGLLSGSICSAETQVPRLAWNRKTWCKARNPQPSRG